MKNLIKLEVDLGDNEIGDVGYGQLIDNLIGLKKLEKVSLILDDNKIKKEGYENNIKNLR